MVEITNNTTRNIEFPVLDGKGVVRQEVVLPGETKTVPVIGGKDNPLVAGRLHAHAISTKGTPPAMLEQAAEASSTTAKAQTKGR